MHRYAISRHFSVSPSRGAPNHPGGLTGNPAIIDTGEYEPPSQTLYYRPAVTMDALDTFSTQTGRPSFDPRAELSSGSLSEAQSDSTAQTFGAPSDAGLTTGGESSTSASTLGSADHESEDEFDDPILAPGQDDDDEFEDVPFTARAAPPEAAEQPAPLVPVGDGLETLQPGKRTRKRRRDGQVVPASSLPYHTYKISKRALRRQKLFYLGTSEDQAIFTTGLGAYWSDVRHFQCKVLTKLLVRRGMITDEIATNINVEIEAVLEYLWGNSHVLQNNHSNGSSTLWVGLLAQQHVALKLGRGWSVQKREDVAALSMNRFWEAMDSTGAVQTDGDAGGRTLCIKTSPFDEMAARNGAVQLDELLRDAYSPEQTKKCGMTREEALRPSRGDKWEEPLLYSGLVQMRLPAVEENHEVAAMCV